MDTPADDVACMPRQDTLPGAPQRLNPEGRQSLINIDVARTDMTSRCR